MPSVITRLTSHFIHVLMSALDICKQRKECGRYAAPSDLTETRYHETTQTPLLDAILDAILE